ncbi:MAG: DUF4065 domain-containing protein [Fimbriimonadaceae bacterium]|nr:DUF4065 domain-containing protein [Fimbriimonadaceae bacterium]QOJ11896.1 MAG: SocA family protein [Chthonomonadaceae bacterium]
MKAFRPDSAKLRELILYICNRCDLMPSWGRTKLAKLLYFSDFRHYRKHGRPITCAIYVCAPQGPIPDGFHDRLKELTKGGDLVEIKREIGDYSELRPTAVRPANLKDFAPEEISTVEWVINEYAGLTATELSEISHREPGWMLANPGERIPYEAALISKERPTEEELDFLRKQLALEAR